MLVGNVEIFEPKAYLLWHLFPNAVRSVKRKKEKKLERKKLEKKKPKVHFCSWSWPPPPNPSDARL